MQQDIDSEDRRAPEMAQAIERCVHCGFCLAACPTYRVLGGELDSPRGRITLMKHVLERRIDASEAQPYIDRCLGCMACVPACPSGVAYGDLLLGYRSRQGRQRQGSALDALTRQLIEQTLPYPRRFRIAAQTGRLGRALQGKLPPAFAAMLSLLPERLPAPLPLPPYLPARGDKRGQVALLLGCAQQVLAPEISYAAAQVLAENGVDVHIPPAQGCCGSILLHAGSERQALALARRNLAAIPAHVDAIITTAAGCGSGIGDYALLFKGEPDAPEATAFAAKTADLHVYLARIGLLPPARALPLRVVYQDACHLLHAQGIGREPRALLAQIAQLELLDIADADQCCGSAGRYNIDQPEIAQELGRRKVAAILAAAPDLVVSGNIGCISQLRMQLKRAGKPLPLLHSAQLLWRAYAPPPAPGEVASDL